MDGSRLALPRWNRECARAFTRGLYPVRRFSIPPRALRGICGASDHVGSRTTWLPALPLAAARTESKLD
jgi:hypothetical protein